MAGGVRVGTSGSRSAGWSWRGHGGASSHPTCMERQP